MNGYGWVVLVLAFAFMGVLGCNSHSQSPGSDSQDIVVADPVAWTNDFFLRETFGEIGKTTLTAMDLDQDGVNEWLVETTAGFGSGGTNHAAFRKVEGGYVLLGTFAAKWYEPLPADPDGNVRIKAYWRTGYREGVASWLVSRNGAFVEEREEPYRIEDEAGE